MLRSVCKKSLFRVALPKQVRTFYHGFRETYPTHRQDIKNLASQFPSVGIFRQQNNVSETYGSGVYIGDNLVLTAAHCINKTDSQTFSFDGKQWHNIIATFQHPNFITQIRPFINDIAIAKLDDKASSLPIVKLEINYNRFEAMRDCVMVGYVEHNKFAAVIPSCLHSLFWIEHRFGINEQRSHPLEGTSLPGMSGGGLFSDNKLIALVSGGSAAPIYLDKTSKVSKEYKARIGEITNFTPLFFHQKWINEKAYELNSTLGKSISKS